jgi:farnesyl-diphosphate farnesyltransferase
MSVVDWRLLKKVSRSFYLTLFLLPAPVRESIAQAYLLARLSDTKADGAESEAERELLRREASLVEDLSRSPDSEEIERVWRTIQEGQDFDLQRFAGENAGPLTVEELDRYTYLVAGCVGEFWTRMCARHLPGFARLDVEVMKTLGVEYGKGLQLINILRDRAEDRAKGRVYIEDGMVPYYLRMARAYLRSGETYAKALKIRRLRVATALPVLIGRETLDLLESAPHAARQKVSRARMRRIILRSLFY